MMFVNSLRLKCKAMRHSNCFQFGYNSIVKKYPRGLGEHNRYEIEDKWVKTIHHETITNYYKFAENCRYTTRDANPIGYDYESHNKLFEVESKFRLGWTMFMRAAQIFIPPMKDDNVVDEDISNKTLKGFIQEGFNPDTRTIYHFFLLYAPFTIFFFFYCNIKWPYIYEDPAKDTIGVANNKDPHYTPNYTRDRIRKVSEKIDFLSHQFNHLLAEAKKKADQRLLSID